MTLYPSQRHAGAPDTQIVQRTLAGERQAFEGLLSRYGRMAYAIAFARLGNHQDAEDAVQESWLQAFATLDRLRNPEQFPAWVGAIVRNVSINAARNRWRKQPLEEAGSRLMIDVRKPLEDADVRRTLWAQVETMTPEYREVLTLHYHAGMSTEEIAAAARLPRETVKKRLQRARAALSEQTLRQLFEPAEREEENRRRRLMALVLIAPIEWKQDNRPIRAVPVWRRSAMGLTHLGSAARRGGWWVLAFTILAATLIAAFLLWHPVPSALPSPVITTPAPTPPPPRIPYSGGKGAARVEE